jgi:3-dehydroquinate synthase
MVMASELSLQMGAISEQELVRITQLLSEWALPTTPPEGMAVDDFMALMYRDKKVQDGQLRLVLLSQLGKAEVSSDFEAHLLEQVLLTSCST